MVTRRSLLASTTALASATVAGCSAVLGEETDHHYVDMLNGSEESHAFAVTITDDAGETLFDRTYDLPARNGDENRVIDGSPASVAVAVDDDEPVQFPWAPREGRHANSEECSQGTSASLSIYYDPQSGDGVTPIYGCETAQDQ
ncbi:hypothetical protein [Natrialba sp. PRR66]|uniref:hypothetical protein n=1 Tax=Natrialba sp. PRR66 TaxID=3098146 RepID=UPI002B1D569B|nr:hypothetical protein [Natrialba sp. PRR66]